MSLYLTYSRYQYNCCRILFLGSGGPNDHAARAISEATKLSFAFINFIALTELSPDHLLQSLYACRSYFAPIINRQHSPYLLGDQSDILLHRACVQLLSVYGGGAGSRPRVHYVLFHCYQQW